MTDNYIHEYNEKLKDGTYQMRVGKEVPEGDVNLGYIHTPRLHHDEKVAIVNTSSDPDNVIPYEQKESIVVPDHEGKLSYASLHKGADSVREKPPFDVFPSKNLNITRQFKNNRLTTENALYYKFEIMYHYDSMANEPNKVIKYTGDQIQLTDENGNPITSGVKYDIYVMAMEGNPHIHWVKIYMNATTNDIDTFKIRYNHIDEVVSDNYIESSPTELELYRNNKNQLVAHGIAKQLVEGGKLRIINSDSAFRPVSKEEFDQADETDEVYHVVEDPIKNGYEVYVKQKAEMDPRDKKIFNYKVVAKFKDSTGVDQEVTTGYINDWVAHADIILNHERYDYTGEWKTIGIPNGKHKFNVKDMIELSLPPGTPSIPDEAVYEIYDAKGNLMYTTVDAKDNPNVTTIIQEEQNDFAAARADGSEGKKWHNAEYPNAMLKSYPLEHEVSVIAETQKTKWDYEFKVTGEGVINTPTVYTGNWWVSADVGFYKSFTSKPLDVLNKDKWNAVGTDITPQDWKVQRASNGVEYLELQKNIFEVAGFYQKVGPQGQNMSQARDYEFSAKVKVVDPGDDDVIGIMFRVQNDKRYYIFAWERDSNMLSTYHYRESDYPENAAQRPTSNGPGRVMFGDGGCGGFTLNKSRESNPPYRFNNEQDYLNYGFGSQKKRIYKAEPRPPHVPGYTGYSSGSADSTGCSYTDITLKNELYYSSLGSKGWEVNKEYKITVVVAGDNFKIYINENADSPDRGELVCEGTDSTYKTGSVGIFNVSQRWAQWRDLVYNELEVKELSTDPHPVTFLGHQEIRVSDVRVPDMLKDKIEKYAKDNYTSNRYEVFEYKSHSDKSDIYTHIDEAGEGFVWAHTTNPQAGGNHVEVWKTSDNHLDVYGSGHVEYHEDGNFTITVNPKKLPTEKIPPFVENFHWHEPVVTKGENIKLKLGPDGETIIAEVETPPIKPLDTWTTFESEPIHISDGIVPVTTFKEIMDKLKIPEDVPLHEVMLRIERGRMIEPNNVINQEHRVNYRFRLNDQGRIRYPVDQFRDQLGVNRLRLSGLYQEYLPVEFNINYEVMVPRNKRTNMQTLFSRNASGAVMIEEKPNVATWKTVNGRLVDDQNTSHFVAAYNRNHLNTTDHITDFSFRITGTDNDLVGVIFRVQDKNNFYFYAIEGDKINTSPNSNRISDVQPAPLFDWRLDSRRNYASDADFVTKAGWKVYHQRVYQVKNGRKTVVAEKSVVTNQGHISNWQNNIRVECYGNITNLYFQTGTINEKDWKRAYRIETEWDKGAYGVFNYSQTVEFLNIETSDLITIKGTVPKLNYTGRPSAVMAENTRDFCDDYVRSEMKKHGFTGKENYVPVRYVGVVTNGNGNVSVSSTGEGPIQVFSNVDPSQMAAEVDMVAWTHHEDLEVVPVFAVKIDEDKKIDIEKPKVEEAHLELENWYLRIKNGRFHKTIQLPYYEPEERTPSIYQYYPVLKAYAPKDIDDIEEVTLEYSIPEYTNQEFYDRPITLVDRETPIILDEYSIQTKNQPIILESNNHISYVEVEAFRNNTSRYLRIKDIDAKKGIIYLLDRIRKQDEVIVRYAYHEDWYTYRGFTLDSHRFHLDLNPSPGHTHTVASDGIFEWIPIDSIPESTPLREKSSNELLVKSIHVYLRPTFIRDKNGQIIEGTQHPQVIRHTDDASWFNPKDYKYDPTMFRLGKVFIQANSELHTDGIVLDTRTRGGGLDEALSRKIINTIEREALYHWDIGYFDGMAYQENGVIIIRLPKTILKSEENPKGFHESEVYEAIQKHKAYGVLPIIEYYDPEKLKKQPFPKDIDKNNAEIHEF